MTNKQDQTLIIYQSTDGHTIKICNRIADTLKENNVHVLMTSIDELEGDLEEFDQIIIAASIRYGAHHKKIIQFIDDHTELLDRKNNAFVSVNLVARKPEKNTAETNPYVKKFLEKITWKPQQTFVFAGNLDYSKYSFFDRIMIQLIMKITGGPTNRDAKIDYTDWDRVKASAEQLLSQKKEASKENKSAVLETA